MTFFDTPEQQCKDAFIKAGFWPNEVMWSAWEKAWKLGADAKSEELRKQEPTPKGFIVVSKDLLAEAIACNTDASLADARHIINSVLKVSDDEIFREALKELAAMK